MKRILNILTALLALGQLYAADLSAVQMYGFEPLGEESHISLLTCTPGEPTYSKYGHSAIRVVDPQQKIDLTFNYGVFSFGDKDFYLKFVRGETYYHLDVEATDDFIISSSWIGRTTYEQELNLNTEARNELFDALLNNYLPENRYYLYNFVFDNCATQPYHLLKKAVNQPFRNQEFANRRTTFRQSIRHYSESYSWVGWGIDFIFGKGADEIMTPAQRLFLPEELSIYLAGAKFDNGEPVCLTNTTQPFEIKSHSLWLSPQLLMILLALLIVGISIWQYLRLPNKTLWGIDVALLVFYGLLGTVGCYLSFFSIHPFVEHNFNLLIFNSLMLFFALMISIKPIRLWLEGHNLTIIACGTMLLLVSIRLFCGQAFHTVLFLPLAHVVRLTLMSVRKIQTRN